MGAKIKNGILNEIRRLIRESRTMYLPHVKAEALEEKAIQKWISIKVETDGSGGTKYAPTANEIEECEAIIPKRFLREEWK